MNSPTVNRDPKLEGMDSRAMVRYIANDMVANQDFPSAERVRKRIQADTGGKVNPSTVTVQDEMRKWLADTFWPTHNALGALPDDPQVPHALKRLYQEGFQALVVGSIAAAGHAWDQQREEFAGERREAAAEHDRLQSEVSHLQNRLVEAETKLANATDENGRALAENARLKEALATTTQDLKEALQAQAEHERALNAARQTERDRAEEQIRLSRKDAERVLLDLDEQRQAVKRIGIELTAVQAVAKGQTERAIKAEAVHGAVVAENGALKAESVLKNGRIAELEALVDKLRAAQTREVPKKVVTASARDSVPRRQFRKNVNPRGK